MKVKSIVSDFSRGICPSPLTKKVPLSQFLPIMPITQLCLFGPRLCPSQEIKEIKQDGHYHLFVLPSSPQSPCCYLIVRGLLLVVFCADLVVIGGKEMPGPKVRLFCF